MLFLSLCKGFVLEGRGLLHVATLEFGTEGDGGDGLALGMLRVGEVADLVVDEFGLFFVCESLCYL